ncbi:MAG: translocation/assembly module TamB domain-containing protein [Candidatus Glassbacteria bacterium]|nr:translocation/assembly module TamB domain-containing protein [Candidatus Glassbacteria bacterium]
MSETPKKSRLRNFLRMWRHYPVKAFVRLGLISVALFAALTAVVFHAFRDEIELMVSHWVEEQTYRLFRPKTTFSLMEMPRLGKFIFHDFRIEDPFGETDYFIETSRVEVEFNPLQLISRGINLSRVHIYGGNFQIHKEGHDGPLNISRIFKSPGGKDGPAGRVRIGEFLLKDCRILLEDIESKPIENKIAVLQGRFTSISGEHLVEVDTCSLNTTYWSVGPAELSGIFPIRKDYLGFRRVRVVKGETDLTGEGFVDFAGRSFEYKIRNGSLEAAHLPPELEVRDRFSGTVGVSLAWAGSFDSSTVQVDLSLDKGVVFGYPVSELTTRLSYGESILRFQQLKADICGGSLAADLEFRFRETDDSYDIKADVQNAVVEQIGIPRLERLKGRMSGQLALHCRGYSLRELELAGSARRLRGKLNGVQIDSAGVSFNYRQGKLRVNSLAVHSWESITTAIGDVENNELFLFVSVERIPARRLRQILPLADFSGTIDLSGSLTGSLFDPVLKGAVSIGNGAYRFLSFDRLEGTCELEHLTSTIEGQLQLDLYQVDLAGHRFEKLHLNTEIPHTGMTRFSPVILVQDSLNSLYCSGFYTATPETGEQEIVVDTLELLYRGVRASTGNIFEIRVHRDTTRITSVDLSSMGGTISGEIDLYGTGSLKAEVNFAGLDFGTLAALSGSSQPAEGKLDGKLNISGQLSGPRFTLAADLENARFSLVACEKVKAAANIDSGILTIDRLELTDSDRTSIITGRLPLTAFYRADTAGEEQGDDRVEISASLDRFPLSAIKTGLIPLSEGTLQGQLRISGTVARPALSGEVALEGGAGVIAPINTRLQNMSGQITLEADRIVLTGIRSSSPEGLLLFSGQVMLEGLKPTGLELDITGNELILQQFRYVTQLKVSTRLKLAGSLPDLLLTGEVRVLEGEVSPNFGQVAVGPGEQAPRQSALVQIPPAPIDYDLHFTADEDFWLRNRNASIKLKANIRAVQQENNPQVAGEITTVAGTYTIFGRRFKIRQGSLQFQGQATVNPLLDINAERVVRGKVLRGDLAGTSMLSHGSSGATQVTGEQYEIDRNTFYLHIGGNLNDPQFEITVKDNDDRTIEPPLTPEQARTLVLVDQTYREFQQQSSFSQSKLLDQAANMALNQANPYIQEFTGIDEFSIESQLFDRSSSETSNDERASAKVTMGEFLFESVFFSFSQDLLDPSARSVQIEYLIGRKSSIIGQTDSRGHFSLDFRYLIKY